MDFTLIWQFLNPFVNVAALPMLGTLIAGVVQVAKLLFKFDMGRLQWVPGIVLYGVYFIFTKGYVGHIWYESIFVVLATGICAAGIFTVTKKTGEVISEFFKPKTITPRP